MEAILILSGQMSRVHSIDVAALLGVSKPSVSRAVSILKAEGYVEMEPGGNLSLTERGLITARQVYERHELLTEFLVKLGVTRSIAVKDACRIEHVISAESFEKLRNYALEQIRHL